MSKPLAPIPNEQHDTNREVTSQELVHSFSDLALGTPVEEETENVDGETAVKQMDKPGSYGAGNRNRNRSSTKFSSKSKAAPEKEIVLTESDDDYPKDIPKGAKHYQKFWRHPIIRAVMDQGLYRTCWTIASNRCLSARLLIEDRADHPLFLSALHILVGLFKKTDNTGGLENLEHLRNFLKKKGTLLEEDCTCEDPFAAAKTKKAKGKAISKMPPPLLCTKKRRAKRKFKVQDLIILDKVDEKELIRLVDHGPVAITLEIYKGFDTLQGDGIYKGPKKGERKIDDHMMLLTGYGTYQKQHYWLCQNSAGLNWGEDGFLKILRQISRDKGQPSLFSGVIYPMLLHRGAYNP